MLERMAGPVMALWMVAWLAASVAAGKAAEGGVMPSRTGKDGRMVVSLYVSTKGRDSWTGTKQRPYATLERARDELRSMRASGRVPDGSSGAIVWVFGGDYPREGSFELDGRDSGTASWPVTYASVSGQTPRLIGGKTIDRFEPVRDAATLDRLPESARKRVVQVDLARIGVTEIAPLSSRGFGRPVHPAHLELFHGDQPMTLARWPNAGRFATITGFTVPENDEWGSSLGKLDGGFSYDGGRPKRWKWGDDIWVHGYWSYDWANSYERVRSIDPVRGIVETHPPHGNYNFRPGQRFYFVNVLEEIDEPGEYYVDRQTRILYFWPASATGGKRAVISTLGEPLIRMNGSEYVTIRGLTLECGRGDGIEVRDGAHVTVEGCVLRNMGNWGAVVEGGTNHSVLGCDIYGTGDGGVRVSGGDRKTLVSANHRIDNCHIHHYGRWSRCYQPGVLADGCGLSISRNLIHDAPHNGILYGGNEMRIEYNEIHSVCMETGDAGAIYTGRDYTYRGNQIRHNFIHHTGGVGMGTMGVYMDDCVSGHRIEGNAFWETTRAVFLGGGRDFVVANNLFIDCRPAVAIDGRGMDRNPVWHGMVYRTMKERLEAMNYRQPPYSARYPDLATLEKYYRAEDGIPPENNVVTRNVCSGGEWLSVGWHADPAKVEMKDNLVADDPGFVNRARGDFRLRPDSPAYRMGFKPIQWEKIGPQIEGARRKVPVRSLVRGFLTVERKPSVTKDGVIRPGMVRLDLENLGQRMERGVVSLLVIPDEAGTIDGDAAAFYTLKPGGKLSRRFTVSPAAGREKLRLAEHRRGESAPRHTIEVEIDRR